MELPDRFTVDDACVFWRGLDVRDAAAITQLAAAPFPGNGGWEVIEGCEDAVAEVGTALPALTANWPAQRILRFLILSGIVRTFVHVEAELSLRKRVRGTARHVELYDASHVYFTNEENREKYAFALSLSSGTGQIEAMPI